MDAAIFGVIVADVIGEPIDPRRPPKAGGLAYLNSLELTTGGNVCNVSIAMAKLGAQVAGAGLVGDDILGRAIVERLKSAGVDTSAIFASNKAQTSATIVAVEPTGGQRSFYHSPGVMPLLDAETFRRSFPVFRQCAWVQIGYFGLLPTPLVSALPQLFKELKQTAPGAKIALDTLDPPGDMAQLEPLLRHVDVFCPSRPEAAALTGEKLPRKIIEALRQHMPAGLIGIKLDSEGCYLDDVQQSVTAPAYDIKARDTTGAGDTWFAGLLVALRKQMPLEQAARFANRVAADCCTAIGASAGVKSFEETMARLNDA